MFSTLKHFNVGSSDCPCSHRFFTPAVDAESKHGYADWCVLSYHSLPFNTILRTPASDISVDNSRPAHHRVVGEGAVVRMSNREAYGR